MDQPLDLQNPTSWPGPVKAVLEAHRTALDAWQLDLAEKSASTLDLAVKAVGDALRPYSLRGWHCTRLTTEEVSQIEQDGLAVLDSELLERRIAAQEFRQAISPAQAQRLRTQNQAQENGRRGKAWFCFYPPRLAGQDGTERLFTSWGGEALYNFCERDAELGPALREIGAPSLVQAVVPISYLPKPDRVVMTIARVELALRWERVKEIARLEDYSVNPVDAKYIERIIRFPEDEFVDLTGCARWNPQLFVGKYP